VYPDGSRTFTGYLRGVGEKVARTFARWTNCGEGWWIVHPSDATQIGAWDTILAEERAAAA
jgi:hypothetical protein